jgi:hypothetical protein
MTTLLRRGMLLIMIPFLPLTFFVDVVFGDAVTGVKTSIKQKMLEHIKTFKDLWR